MPPWRGAGWRPSWSTGCGDQGKWRNLAQPPAGAADRPPDALDDFLASAARRSRLIVHLGAISETTATDGDLAWATNVELPLRLWHWCATARRAAASTPPRPRPMATARRASTTGSTPLSTGCGRSTSMAGPSTPSTSRVARMLARRGAAPAAMGRAEVLQRLSARTNTTRAR